MKIMTVAFSMLIALATAPALAHLDLQVSLKKAVANTFVTESNKPNSALNKVLTKINQDAKDKRNPQGPIALPVQLSDIQVVSFHSADGDPTYYKNGSTCIAQSQQYSFLVFLNTKTVLNRVVSYDRVVFLAQAWKENRKDILGDQNQDCDDPNGNFSKETVKSVASDDFVLSYVAIAP